MTEHVITLEIIFPRAQSCIIIFYAKKRVAYFSV